MKYLIENSVFQNHRGDPNLEYVTDHLRNAVESLTKIGMRPRTIIDALTAEILAFHKANPFRDPVDEAALMADLESIWPVQNRINNLVKWLEQGLERADRAKEGV